MPSHKRLTNQATKPSHKLNLIRRRLAGKRAGAGASTVWYICKNQNGNLFYLAEYDEERKVALWCRRKEDALLFHTEAGLQQYISLNFSNRSDIILVQAPKT